mgnify:CR=1 FL=1
MHIPETHSPKPKENVIGKDVLAKLGLQNRGRADNILSAINQVNPFGGEGFHSASGANSNTFHAIDTDAFNAGHPILHTYGLGRARLHTEYAAVTQLLVNFKVIYRPGLQK